MKVLYAAALVAGLTGCSDAGITSVAPRDPVTPSQNMLALAPFSDALQRIVPSLGNGESVDAVRAALTSVIYDGSDAALYDLDAALDRLIAAQPHAAAEADVIRLAIQR